MDWKDYILEWLEDARKQAEVQAMRPNGTRYKLQAIERAASSVRENTTTVTDITDLKNLPRVGDKTLLTLKQKWANFLKKNPSFEKPPSFAAEDNPKPSAPPVLANQLAGQMYPFAPPPLEVTAAKKKRSYIPKYGSAAYYALITMREYEAQSYVKQGIGQTELKRLMKNHTSEVLDGAVSGSTPSVGAALRSLQKNELVYTLNGRFFLETEGRDLANRLLRAAGKNVQTPEKRPSIRAGSLSPTRENSIATETSADGESENDDDSEEDRRVKYQTATWEPGTFKTKIVLDSREVASRQDRSGLSNDLRNKGLDIEVSPLSLGDCLWVAEHETGRRAVLDWIVERKTLADLRSSIHDGRFQEQKQRLAKSTVKNAVYLIEIANNAANSEMFKENKQKFLTAMSQTLVRHGFYLKLTRSQNETVQYLSQLTNLLEKKYADKPLTVVVPNISNFGPSMSEARNDLTGTHLAIDFSAFHEGLTKSKLRTIGDTFQLMLRTIKGVSPEKAMAIQREFPTPAHLMKAYEDASTEDDKQRLLNIVTQSCVRRQQVNVPLSDAIYRVWGSR